MTRKNNVEIWYLIGTLAVGGAEKTVVDLVNSLDDCYDATIWTIADAGPLASEVDESVRVRSLNADGKYDVAAVVRFVRALHRERPDLLQSFLFFDNTVACVAGMCCPETTVIAGVREVPNDISTFRRVTERLTFPLADHVVSNSTAGRDYMTGRGIDPGTVSVVNNGRDLKVYRDARIDQSKRETLGLPSDVPIVGTVGRLIERKGHHELVECWPSVLDAHPDAKLVLVGDGPEKEALMRRAERNSVRESVQFLGTRDDVPELLDAMDVFAFPSHYEGLPGALLEAMAARLPIVATPVDGNAELLREGVDGTFVPPKRPDALGEAVRTLLEDQETANQLAANASERAHRQFTLDAMISDFEHLYRTLVEGQISR